MFYPCVRRNSHNQERTIQMSNKTQLAGGKNSESKIWKVPNIGKLSLILLPLGLFISSYTLTIPNPPALAHLNNATAAAQTEVPKSQTKSRQVTMTDLRSAISESAAHDSALQRKLSRIVDQAESSASRGNSVQAARSLNSVTTTVFSTPESRLSRQQKVAIMVALDKSWRESRLSARNVQKAHVKRDGHCCSLQKGKGRCLPDPDNLCFEGRNAKGQWSCISEKPCPGQ